jgi:putative ABC transport system substrate-binding protein
LLTPGPLLAESDGRLAAMTAGLAGHGYVAGRNLIIEQRAARGRTHELPRLAQELAAAKVDVIVTNGFPTAAAAKATGLPTVTAAGVGDPVATGLIESLARPGTNVTGISDDAGELSTKRLGLLKELVPQLRRVAMLWNQDDLGMTLRYRASSEAAAGLGVAVQALGVREPDDFNVAFAAMDRDQPEAILMVSDSLTVLNRTRVFDYAAAHRLPAIYETDMFVRDGGLMSYGADTGESYRRAAAFVEQILRGANPAELPFERPTRYVLSINTKTAAAIGLSIPPLLIARADEVIE